MDAEVLLFGGPFAARTNASDQEGSGQSGDENISPWFYTTGKMAIESGADPKEVRQSYHDDQDRDDDGGAMAAKIDRTFDKLEDDLRK